MGPIIAAVVARKRRQLIGAFRNAGATSAATARTLDILGVAPNFLFEIQKRRGVIVDAGGGRYYLDEERERETTRHKLTILAVVLVVVVIALALVLATR